MTSAHTIGLFRGPEITPWLDDVARLRVAVFRDWPYLYEGDADYERDYLGAYARSAESVFVLAMEKGEVIGASTGLPLADDTEAFRRPFVDGAIDPEDVFYFGESVLAPAWRGQGLGVRFFEERERYARSLPGITMAAFCAVDRSPDDPRRPPDYIPLDQFWQNRGFQRTALQTHFTWKESGETTPSPKSLTFWTKILTPTP